MLANIVGTADNGCSVCVGNLVERLNKAFPQFKWERGRESVPLYDREDYDDWSTQLQVTVSTGNSDA
jgi:hypothetical protein